MSGTGINILDALAAKLKHLSARQTMVSANIANADTPGYRAREIADPDFAAMVGATSRGGAAEIAVPRVAVSSGLRALGAAAAPEGNVRSGAPGYEVKESGNSVILEEELMRLAQIQMDYAEMTNLYRKQAGLLKIAIGRGE
jgi:flagellar basal-body rod protein FlgB